MIICIAVGSLIGEILDLDAKLNNLGQHIEDKLNSYKKDYTKEKERQKENPAGDPAGFAVIFAYTMRRAIKPLL